MKPTPLWACFPERELPRGLHRRYESHTHTHAYADTHRLIWHTSSGRIIKRIFKHRAMWMTLIHISSHRTHPAIIKQINWAFTQASIDLENMSVLHSLFLPTLALLLLLLCFYHLVCSLQDLESNGLEWPLQMSHSWVIIRRTAACVHGFACVVNISWQIRSNTLNQYTSWVAISLLLAINLQFPQRGSFTQRFKPQPVIAGSYLKYQTHFMS